jgi:hypothetical protein
MGLDPAMAILGLVCALALPLVLLAAVYVGARALGSGGRSRVDSARALLDRRLAEGAIDIEEYYERDSALRSTEPTNQRSR